MPKLEFTTTERGFDLATFTDAYGAECSIQKSSSAEDDHIWLGVDHADPKILARDTPQGGNGWLPYHLPDGVLLTTRMHLTREQVAELLPALQLFVDTGELTK